MRVRKLVGAGGRGARRREERPPRSRARGRGAIDYYEMYDLVALQFASVRMIGQVPFSGVALAELGESDEDPAVSVDTQLAGENEAPEVYIALAAQRDVRLEPYAIVQLPRERPTRPRGARGARDRAEGDRRRAQLAAAVLRADLLNSQLEEQRARRS